MQAGFPRFALRMRIVRAPSSMLQSRGEGIRVRSRLSRHFRYRFLLIKEVWRIDDGGSPGGSTEALHTLWTRDKLGEAGNEAIESI